MSLKDFIKEVLDLGRDDVFKVDVKDSFSFFNTDKAMEKRVLDFFTDFKYNGRFVNVEVTENKGGGGRRDRGGRGKRRSDDRRGKKRSSDSGFRSERRGRRSDGPKSDRRRSGSGSDRPRRSGSGSGTDRPRRSRRR